MLAVSDALNPDTEIRRMRATDLHLDNRIVDDDGSEHQVTYLTIDRRMVRYKTDTGRDVWLTFKEAHGTWLNIRV